MLQKSIQYCDNQSQYDTAAIRLKCEKIIKWCLHARSTFISKLYATVKRLKAKCEFLLSNFANGSSSYNERLKNLCGSSRHTASTESYFYEKSYTFMFNSPITLNSHGQVTNILPLKNKKKIIKWTCDKNCRIQSQCDNNVQILNKYKNLLAEIQSLKFKTFPTLLTQLFIRHSHNKLLGHPVYCDGINGCSSKLQCIEFLSPHFPMVRYIKRMLYTLKEFHSKLSKLDQALQSGNFEYLNALSTEMSLKGKVFNVDDDSLCLNEDEIEEKNKNAFLAFTKLSSDLPKYVCISCQKLCFERNVTKLTNLKKSIVNTNWDKLVDHVELRKELKSDFICDYCLLRFRRSQISMPPNCLLNNLDVGKIPEQLSNLNDYEKILIQRAKAFQVIQRMENVSKKKLPYYVNNKKMKGRTIYFPLPIKETLEKICPATEPINKNHALYILIRGVPTKSNIIWENLVNVQKVFDALKWLKEHNPHYSRIHLPLVCNNFLKNLNLSDVEFQVQSNFSGTSVSTDEDLSNNSAHDNFEKLVESSQMLKSPILTLVDKDNEDILYEKYTIYPMHDKRIHDTSTNLYQMKKVKDIPIDNRLKVLDLLCFPDLYPYGKNGQHQQRTNRLIDYEYIKLRVMSADSRFRLNQSYLFHLINDANIRQLNSGIYHCLNITDPRQKHTAKSYLQRLQNGELESNLTTIFERLRNSAQFWKKPRNELECMTRYYGPATWFLTVSPAEYNWHDLIQYIRDINDLSFNSLSDREIIAIDPVSVARFIDNKFQALLAFILSEDNPIGEINHYFWRREYQSRGTPHFHLMLWVENAPTIGENSNEEIAQFITNYLTCKIPVKNVSPNLYRRVDSYQRHHHNSYCLRSKKRNAGYTHKVCRFSFPRAITKEFILRDVAESIAGRKSLKSKSRLYDLPRNKDEIFINDYNPAILCVWEGNMDLQFIGEKSLLLSQYITKYISKFETSALSDVFKDISTNKSLMSRIWNYGFRVLNNRDVGAIEAADTLLGMPLYRTDPKTTVKWLDVRQVRNRMLKKRELIESLDPNSNDIFCPSILDDYYPNRPIKLNELSLYEFAKAYDIVRTKPINESCEFYEISNSLYLKKRNHDHLINHWRYNIYNDPENYYYALLLLHQPWRTTDELKNGFQTYTESFASICDDLVEAAKYHKNLEELRKGLENISDDVNRILNKNENCQSSNNLPGMSQLDAEVQAIKKDLADAANKANDNENLDEMISQLNSDQKRVFQRVQDTLRSKNNEVLRLYVSGEGGTGKSFLIKVIRCWIKKELNKETSVNAPTGIAAFNIDGLTVHRTFQLPVEHGYIPKYTQLSDSVLKILRDQFKNIELIIIDEVSMISNVILLYIHLRLVEIFNVSDENVNSWFGGKHILFFGDLCQLPPVREDPVYIDLSDSKVEKLLGSLGFYNLWTNLIQYDELTINMRQQSDTMYGDLLSRLRFGTITSEDIKLLNQRKINIDSKLSYDDRLRELCDYIDSLPVDTVCLLPINEQCELINSAMLERINSEEITLIAQDLMDGPKSLSKTAHDILNRFEDDASHTAGLSKVIKIKVNAKIMIRRNLDVTLGIVNGSIGKITSVSRNVLSNSVESINIQLNNGNECTIERANVKFQVMDKVFVIREQFPISLSYAFSIHKSQGLSLKNAVIDAGNSIFSCGQTYVALSRLTTLEGLHLINFDPHEIKANFMAIEEYNRLRNIYKPELPQIEVNQKRWAKVPDFQWAVKEFNMADVHNDVDATKFTESWSFHGLNNHDGVSSYINSSLQCIFNCVNIRNKLLEQTNDDNFAVLKTVFTTYVNDSINFNSKSIKQYVGEMFCNNLEQHPSYLVQELFNKNEGLRKLVNVQFNCTEQCKKCEYVTQYLENKCVITVSINPKKNCIHTLQELIDQLNTSWYDEEKVCSNCMELLSIRRKTQINSTNAVIIVNLGFNLTNNYTGTMYKKGFLKSVPSSKIVVCKKNFIVNSAIFLSDKTIKNGHWMSVLRDRKSTKWFSVDDCKVQKLRWPQNAKGAHVIFLVQK